MARPVPTRIFHITAIANLDAICRAGRLVSKNDLKAAGSAQVSIAHESIQTRRAAKSISVAPAGTVHDYVPFYFAPRSPMLSAIHHGRVANCALGQEDIVHIESTAESVAEAGNSFVIFPISAAYEYSVACFNSLEGLEEIDWPLFFEKPLVGDFAKYFFSRLDPPRHARREDTRNAEFLVHRAMPLTLVSRIGVATETKRAEVVTILARNGVKLAVTVRPDWYFVGQ